MFKIGDQVTPSDPNDACYGSVGTITNVINGRLLSSLHKDTYEVEFKQSGGNIYYIYQETSLQSATGFMLKSEPKIGDKVKIQIYDPLHPLVHLHSKEGIIKSKTYRSRKDYYDIEIQGEITTQIMHTSEFKIIDDFDLFGDIFGEEEDTIKTYSCPPHERSEHHMELKEKNYERWYFCKICGTPMSQFDPLKKVDNDWPKR